MTRVAATERGARRVTLAPLLLAFAQSLLGLALASAAARADAPPRTLRVGTSADYAPFSFDPEGPAPLDGLDLVLAKAFAADRGLRLEIVRFRWPDLERRLAAGEFDVAMSGITVRPDRSLIGRFTAPVAESGAVALVRESSAVAPVRESASATALDALDRPGITLAVNAGGHLERLARARFPAATVHAMADNAAVLGELVSGRADAAVTDTLEAPAWRARAPGLAVLGPFTRDRKAWLVRADAPELAAALDTWLASKEADGTLATLRAGWLPGTEAGPTATPLPGMVAAMDERLSLMPYVAEAKRAAGRPVRDAAQESRVLDAAVAEAAKAAATAGRPPPSESCVRGLFQAQIDAGSAIQEAVLASPPRSAMPPPDLEGVTRPALARVGARIASALAALQEGLDEDMLRRAVRDGLRTPDLDATSVAALEAAVLRCAASAPDGAASRQPLTGPPGEPGPLTRARMRRKSAGARVRTT
jgi:cyclohexadienyl dehydratase